MGLRAKGDIAHTRGRPSPSVVVPQATFHKKKGDRVIPVLNRGMPDDYSKTIAEERPDLTKRSGLHT